ncbi:hypothetical protein P3T37_002429 [Kitasatospora sp. MAA4]|uniref:hypothetical protein n=1 Tax=Kitasatospora sp. MAA4 TaxID=3035093 RepID=UPI002476A1C1|nr:hypothetical protein [Kitasatospora sp. MAA4]MDH6133035.1 hypothetical protein [Kitasatospora sp. MAA4]
MNTGTISTTSRGLRLALRVYPAAYRTERGEEITAVHADATSGAGRLATARETAGVAAYGLRVRTGLTASGTGGHLLATTAPLAAALALGDQLRVLAHLPQDWGQTAAEYRPALIASAVPGVLWLLVVAAMLLRRWTTARVLAALAAVAAVASWLAGELSVQRWAPGMPPDYLLLVGRAGAGVLWSLLVFAAPGDLLDSTIARRPRAAVLPSLLLAASILDGYVGVVDASLPTIQVVTAIVLSAGLLALVLLRWARLLPAATGVAFLPLALTYAVVFVVPQFFSWDDYWLGNLGVLISYLVGAAVLALLTAGAVRFLKPSPQATGPLGTE